MASDSSSSSSSSSSDDDYKRRKSNKKDKRKTEKKHKKHKKQKKQHKEKKRAKLTATEAEPKATLPVVEEDDGHTFGPALPPALTQPAANDSTAAALIGPVLPGEFLKNNDVVKQVDVASNEEDDDNDDGLSFGPLPQNEGHMSANQIEREKRALELKIAAIEGRDLGQGSAAEKSREEWMLELPDVGLRSGLASLSNMKRTFYAGKDKPDFSDR